MKKILLVAATLSLCSAAFAKVDWKPCATETKKFKCKGSDEAIWKCLEAHDADLSPECQKPHAEADALFKK